MATLLPACSASSPASASAAPPGMSSSSPASSPPADAAGGAVEKPTAAPYGRMVIVKEGDKPVDVIPQEFAARTLVQEYGGGAFAVQDNTVVFSNYKDQRLYKQPTEIGSLPVPLTPDYGAPDVSYAGGVFDPHFSRYVTVMEDRRTSNLNPATTIACINLSGGDIHEPKVLVSGNDFYASPRIDQNKKRMAWIEWGHPNMPWDKSELWVGYFSESGELTKRVCVAGGNPMLVESLAEPKWSPKGVICQLNLPIFLVIFLKICYYAYLGDKDVPQGVDKELNIHFDDTVEHSNEVVPAYTLDAEFTRPLWVFGNRQRGTSYLGVLDCDSGLVSLLDTPFSDLSNVVAGNDYFYIEGASASVPMSIAKVTLDKNKTKAISFSIVWSSSPDVVQYRPFFSTPEFIEFPTSSPGQMAYAYFYPPLNPMFQGLPDEKPPLLVKTHGYGREYRERLLGKWGIVDVDDCCSCARFLVESGSVDEQRLCITGRSAGGYTTLASLAFRDTFKAGASLYGLIPNNSGMVSIGDLSLMRADSQKYDSHYIDNLVGDERAYYERSPINFVNKFTCPVILFQGLDDKVVPPNQARKIYQALKERGLPVALVEYEGEQHGFRKAENIKFTLEQQMVFFARLVGKFEVVDDITPIKIENFD
uniref:Dipeptidyl peptidase family member 6 n=1 Tax=Aegilops tauschii TaxID=37682 RepID=R7WEB2_AEGTA